MAKSKARIVRKRFKQAGEPLTEDSSLRSALNDEQAQAVLDRGLAHIKQKAQETADLPDEEASAHLEKLSDRVRRAMRQVNRQAAENPQATEGQNWAETLRALEVSLADGEGAGQSGKASRLQQLTQKEAAVPEKEAAVPEKEAAVPEKPSFFARLAKNAQGLSEAVSEHDDPAGERPEEQSEPLEESRPSTIRQSDSDKDRTHEAL